MLLPRYNATTCLDVGNVEARETEWNVKCYGRGVVMDNGSSGRLVNHEEGKGKGKTPPPAASKEPHAAANCRMTQPRRSLRVGASGGGVGSVVGAPVGA